MIHIPVLCSLMAGFIWMLNVCIVGGVIVHGFQTGVLVVLRVFRTKAGAVRVRFFARVEPDPDPDYGSDYLPSVDQDSHPSVLDDCFEGGEACLEEGEGWVVFRGGHQIRALDCFSAVVGR